MPRRGYAAEGSANSRAGRSDAPPIGDGHRPQIVGIVRNGNVCGRLSGYGDIEGIVSGGKLSIHVS